MRSTLPPREKSRTVNASHFATRLLDWFDIHGRHELPWQQLRTPYRVWVSEIMLQQTRVQTVIGYFNRFIARFPEMETLASAHEDEVLALWSGLGYYSRARNLQRSARLCIEQYGGTLPNTHEALSALPGIGRSTAAAILAQAHGQRQAILDGNVRRVLARLTGETEWPGKSAVERRLWTEAEARLPHARMADYTQALMDFGATLCRPHKPRCTGCPLRSDCRASAENAVDRIPARKPSKALPTRRTHMLVLRDTESRVLLERRILKGVWQGLWSLPEVPDEGTAARLCESLGIGAGMALPSFTHAFSHYRLIVHPWLHLVREGSPQTFATPERRWISRTEYDHLGLPRPVRTLLESLP